MLSRVFQEYAAPIALSAIVSIGGLIGINHTGRISTLEADSEKTEDVQKTLVQEVKEMTIILTRVETKLDERINYEQRQSDRPEQAPR